MITLINGLAWAGNVVQPPADIATDGHSMFPLQFCSPLVAGILLEMDQGEQYDDPDDLANRPPRRIPAEAVWSNWNKHLAQPRQAGTLAETRACLSGNYVRLNLEDGSAAWLGCQVLALVCAAVRFDRVTQAEHLDAKHAGQNLGAVHFWQGNNPVACMMPVRPIANDVPFEAEIMSLTPSLPERTNP